MDYFTIDGWSNDWFKTKVHIAKLVERVFPLPEHELTYYTEDRLHLRLAQARRGRLGKLVNLVCTFSAEYPNIHGNPDNLSEKEVEKRKIYLEAIEALNLYSDPVHKRIYHRMSKAISSYIEGWMLDIQVDERYPK